jgi:siroheme synthase (precorrin-2 oxidase/ferrochelatase)
MASVPPKQKRNLVVRLVGRTLVSVQNANDPSDEEWNDFLKFVAADPSGLRLLVITDGGAPNSAQRARLQATLKGALPLVAAVSDNMRIRFVAATIALFHSTHGCFTKKEVDKAYDHLKLSMQERRTIEAAIRELKGMLI